MKALPDVTVLAGKTVKSIKSGTVTVVVYVRETTTVFGFCGAV